ncbi:Serine/threonine-protein kinase PK-1 [Streptomyces glaucescens]
MNEDDDGADGVRPAPATSRSPPPLPPRRRTRLRRGPAAIVVAVLLVLGLGAGVSGVTTNSGQFTKVPPVLSKTEQEARDRLADAGLKVGDVVDEYSDTVERGKVIGTDPAAGARVPAAAPGVPDRVEGPADRASTDLDGYPLDKARSLNWEKSGLEPGMVTRELSDSVDQGRGDLHRPGQGHQGPGGHGGGADGEQGQPGGRARRHRGEWTPRTRARSWRRPG